MSNFDRAVRFVLKWEGGYVSDKNDPGGETKYGISKQAYPELDIKDLTEEEAIEIYRRDYWQRAKCDALSWPLSLVVFDTAVNMGVGRALNLLGLIRPEDNSCPWAEYLFLRIEYYNCILGKKYPQFLRGWINRVIDLYKTAVYVDHPLSDYKAPEMKASSITSGGV